MWLFQRIEVFSHVDKAKVENWFIEADGMMSALTHVAARNKFQSNTSGMAAFLDLYYDRIVLGMKDDDARLPLLESQFGLNYWKESSIMQHMLPDPEISLAEIIKIGVQVGVLTEEILSKFVHKPDSNATYRLIEAEIDASPFS